MWGSLQATFRFSSPLLYIAYSSLPLFTVPFLCCLACRFAFTFFFFTTITTTTYTHSKRNVLSLFTPTLTHSNTSSVEQTD